MSIPTFHFVEIETADQDARKSADAQNSSRQAVAEVQQQTKGVGQHRLPKPVVFPVIFRTEPHFASGSAVITGPGDGFYHDPRGTSGVYAWVRDERGYYTGALCWCRVDVERIQRASIDSTAVVGAAAKKKYEAELKAYAKAVAALQSGKAQGDLNNVVVQHYLTFTGVAIKKLPSLTNVTLNPRTVGI